MNRRINKVAVLGSGIMGSRIACHFANIGVEVLLLDMVTKDPDDTEAGEAITIANKRVRNSIADKALETAVRSNPSPVYSKKVLSRISTGNFEDDMPRIASCDWVLEVVVENLEIKKQIFDRVERFRTPGTLVTSNTSGIPIHMMAEGRSEDFQEHFCGTHFFNPPRYLRLLEVIPAPGTKPEVVDFLMAYGDRYLGKTTVLCKDTPAFIANRIGVFSMMSVLHLMQDMDLSVEEVDKYTGPALGRPKSATFRTTDIVGLDTMVNVANGLYRNLPGDNRREAFRLPGYVEEMIEKKWLGDKTGQGFYKKVKSEVGASEILALELKTMEYRPQQKIKSTTLEATKGVEDLAERMKVFAAGTDRCAEFFRTSFFSLFEYVSARIPEISDELFRIDEAMRAGFGWELGPFEVWDALDLRETVEAMEAAGNYPAKWVKDMLQSGKTSFYTVEGGNRKYYDIPSGSYKTIPGTEEFLVLNQIRGTRTVWKNSGTTITDLGDGILNLEFHTKMNTIGGEVIQGINKAIDLSEKEFRGLVIGNDGSNFSAGANVGMIFMMAIEQDWDEINMAVKLFQKTSMRLRYSSVPVILAPHNLTLGGGCEFCLHADHVQLSAETYMGLVEFGVGLIPGGGGTKEFALRASDEFREGQIDLNILKERFLTIGMAKVSTSGEEAAELGYLLPGKYAISMNRSRLLADAKAKAVELAEAGYTRPVHRKDIKVLGKQGLGIVYAGANSMYAGRYISEHDKKISEKLGYVLCGGDLSQPALVSEEYLLELEREAFLSLCSERKTLERIQSILTKGKTLRN
jgi:3-hydroxyacyl-CoA dehydrogenase